MRIIEDITPRHETHLLNKRYMKKTKLSKINELKMTIHFEESKDKVKIIKSREEESRLINKNG